MRKSKSLSFVGEQKKKNRNIKRFVIAFSVFVILLGSFSALMFMKHLNFDFNNIFTSDETTTELTTEAATDAPVVYEGGAKVLVFCENDEHTLDFVMLVDCDFSQMRMSVCSIPVSSAVSYNSFEGSLDAYFVKFGYATFRDAVENSLGIGADRYLKFNTSQFRSFLTKFDDVTVNVENAIDDSKNGLILDSGEQSLSAELFIKYVNYSDDYHKADAMAQFLKIVFSKQHSARIDDLFTYIANNSQTDITIVDFKDYEDRLRAFAQDEPEIIGLSDSKEGEG